MLPQNHSVGNVNLEVREIWDINASETIRSATKDMDHS